MKFIQDYKEGDRVSDIYLCKHKQLATTKNGKPYETAVLQDKTGTIDAKIWDPNSMGIGDYDALDYIEVYGEVTSFQGANQINVKRLRRCQEGEYDPANYLPVSKKDIDQMMHELTKLIDSIENTYLKALLQSFFVEDEDFVKAFRNSSAAKTVHHGFVGGLLEHTLSVTKLCDYYCGAYPMLKRDLLLTAAMLHDIGKAVDHEMEGSHIQLGAELCRKYKESATVINAVESHHGDVEPTSLIACIVQAADTISAARPGARRETLETYTSRLKQLEDISNNFKGVDKSFAIQAGREVRVMVVPEQISDADMVLLARDISKQIEAELEYPGQIKVNVIRESRVTDYAK